MKVADPLCGGPGALTGQSCAYQLSLMTTSIFVGTQLAGNLDSVEIDTAYAGRGDYLQFNQTTPPACLSGTDIAPILSGDAECIFALPGTLSMGEWSINLFGFPESANLGLSAWPTSITPVPEPGTLTLLIPPALLAAAMVRRRAIRRCA